MSLKKTPSHVDLKKLFLSCPRSQIKRLTIFQVKFDRFRNCRVFHNLAKTDISTLENLILKFLSFLVLCAELRRSAALIKMLETG